MRLRVFAVMAAVVLASASGTWAADAPAKDKEGTESKTGESAGKIAPPAIGRPGMPIGGPGMMGGGPGMVGGNWYIGYVGRIVKLTDDQKKTMTEIVEARDRDMKDYQRENAEKIKEAGIAVRESLAKRDRDGIAKAQRAYLQLFAPMHQMMKNSQNDLTNVLTAEQKDELHDYHVMRTIKSITGPVTLSSEQIEQVKAASKGDDLGIMNGRLNQAVQQVLTPEQKVEIAKSRALRYAKFAFARARLTPEQMKQVEALCDEMAKDQPTPSIRATAYAKLTEKINELLTDDQKDAMKKVRKSRFGPGSVGPREPASGEPGDDGMGMPDDEGLDLLD